VATPFEIVDVDGYEIRITNPGKVFWPQSGTTKLDLANYYIAVGPGSLRGCRDRPTQLYRWPNGVDAPDDAFYQKRIPQHRPEWIRTTTIRFPSGRSAVMLAPSDVAHIVWAANLGCMDIVPWPVRATDVDHPDELRLDLDPTSGIPFQEVKEVAYVVRDVLVEHSLVGWPKTSGKRGMHVLVRIEPRWSFTQVRRAALALAREVERRTKGIATTSWWKEERHGVFVDYNQNARDRTVASAYSVRPVSDARVSCPLTWDEVGAVDPAEFRIDTVPERYAAIGDPHEAIDDAPGSLDALLDLAHRDETEGLGDAPWPPHFPKVDAEPPRVQPSRRRAP
jgi:bifunctional non-homologous end joining protein LigD